MYDSQPLFDIPCFGPFVTLADALNMAFTLMEPDYLSPNACYSQTCPPN